MHTSNSPLFEIFENECLQLQGAKKSSISRNKPIYIFGAGKFGTSVANALIKNHYNLLGFVETSPRKKMVGDLPVLSWSELSEKDLSAQLLIGIYNRDMPFDQLRKVAQDVGYQDILMPWDIYDELSMDLGWKYWLSTRVFLIQHIQDIRKTYDLLCDEESKKTLLEICRFRLGINNKYSSFKHLDQQYFNSLTLAPFAAANELSYVDCGAYNGDTFLEADKLLPVSSAYLFEPDPVNFQQLVESTKDLALTPVCIPLAVSDRYQILSFSGSGEGGTISTDGDVHIAAAALDEIFPLTNVDFIKYDVEGAEIPALIGSKNIIERSRPVLVLSLYHRPADLWEIPAILSSHCSGYQFYLRQHFYNSFDSVFYAIPEAQ